MSTITATRPMSKRGEIRRNDTTVKMDVEIAADARIVAAYAGISLAEYLSERLRPLVNQDLQEWQARKSKGASPKPKR